MRSNIGVGRGRGASRSPTTPSGPCIDCNGNPGPSVPDARAPAASPPRRNPLLLASVYTAVLVAVALGHLVALGRSPRDAIGEIHVFGPTIAGLTTLSAASAAYLAWGRFRAFQRPAAFWTALAFGALAILYAGYDLTWPGQGPSGRGIIAGLPNTSAWIDRLATASTGVLLLAAAAAPWPTPGGRPALRRGLAIVWMLTVVVAGALSVAHEASLPRLVVGERFTPAAHLATSGLIALYGGGALLSAARYRKTGNTLLGYLALCQVAVMVGLITLSGSHQRHDIWWYMGRSLIAGGLTTVLFGLLGEYTELYRRERERAEEEQRQRALFFAVLDQMPAGVAIAEAPSGAPLVINRRMTELFPQLSRPTNVLDDHPGRQGYHPDGRPYTVEEWPLVRSIRGETVRDEEIDLSRGDAPRRLVSVNAAPVRDGTGRIVAGVVVDLDVTERKIVEEALRERERQLRELNERLEERVAERTAQLRALTTELTMAEERERRRLARVLHDDLQQILAASIYHLERLRAQASAEASDDGLDTAIAMLRDAILTSRTLTAELSPTILYEMGLAPALRWLATRMHEQHDLRVTVEIAPPDAAASVSDDTCLLLYQCARELMFNVIKHAGVTEATVRLHRPTPHVIELVVADVGTGFDPARLREPHPDGGAYGLLFVSERLQYAGGHLRIESAPGAGACVTVSVPVPADGEQYG